MRKLTLYRDDSTVQVVYENVKHFFWTSDNTVLTIAQITNSETGEHRYIHWPRERFCWFKDEKSSKDNSVNNSDDINFPPYYRVYVDKNVNKDK